MVGLGVSLETKRGVGRGGSFRCGSNGGSLRDFIGRRTGGSARGCIGSNNIVLVFIFGRFCIDGYYDHRQVNLRHVNMVRRQHPQFDPHTVVHNQFHVRWFGSGIGD